MHEVELTKHKEYQCSFVFLDGWGRHAIAMNVRVPARANSAIGLVFVHKIAAFLQPVAAKMEEMQRFIPVTKPYERPNRIGAISRPAIGIGIARVVQHSSVGTGNNCPPLVDVCL